MTSKAIVIGDQHFKINNIPEVDEYIIKLENIVKSKEPDFIVLLGDMLDQHEKIHSVPLRIKHMNLLIECVKLQKHLLLLVITTCFIILCF